MNTKPPVLMQLKDCAAGAAVQHMRRAKSLGFGQMFLSLDDPPAASCDGHETPVLCVGHSIDREVMRVWSIERFRQDPLRRLKARGEFAQLGAQPLVWENVSGQINLLSGSAGSITASERDTMRWVHGYGACTGVNISVGMIGGRRVSISFYSQRFRAQIDSFDDVVAILFYLSHMIREDLQVELQRQASNHSIRLTRREAQCLGWVAQGKNAQETAMIMGLSVQTVRDHLKRVRGKLNSTTRAQALMRATALGFILPSG